MAWGRRGAAFSRAHDHGNAEGQGLAGTGLGLAAHVVPGQRVGDGERLHGEGLFDSLGGQRFDDGVRDTEIGEGELFFELVIGIGGGVGG